MHVLEPPLPDSNLFAIPYYWRTATQYQLLTENLITKQWVVRIITNVVCKAQLSTVM
jgi:hypothetical protein